MVTSRSCDGHMVMGRSCDGHMVMGRSCYGHMVMSRSCDGHMVTMYEENMVTRRSCGGTNGTPLVNGVRHLSTYFPQLLCFSHQISGFTMYCSVGRDTVGMYRAIGRYCRYVQGNRGGTVGMYRAIGEVLLWWLWCAVGEGNGGMYCSGYGVAVL